MRKYLIYFLFLAGALIYFNSCTTERFKVPVEDVNIEFRSHRFDHEIFNADFNDQEQLKQYLYQKYGNFYEGFVERIILAGPADSLRTISEMNRFTQDQFISGLQEDIDSTYTEEIINSIETNFIDAFKRIEFLLPATTTPEIIFFNSGFNNGVVVLEDQLAVGLDFYIGSENHYVKRLPPDQFQTFKREKMNREFLVFDAVKYWLEIELDSLRKNDDLLSEIIFKGKIMFLMDIVFPESEDHLKMRYFKDELLWAENNEYNVWLELANEEVLYNSKAFEIKKWVVDGPFTNVGSIPPESPARLGEWMGWQMMKQYVRENRDLSLDQIINEDNYQKILKYYDPR